ncbi:MAG TPA: metallophosphoesterase [Bryobacteraceae bacterium]|nr:metallophosphoesterase [Bryobacteraceae bacterium]
MSFDLIVGIVFLLAQLRLGLLIRRRVRRRGAATAIMAAAGIVLAAGYVCSYSEVVGLLPLPPAMVATVGAVTIFYLLISVAGLIIYTVIQPILKKLNTDTDLSRRRALQAAGGVLMASPLAAIAYGALVERTNFHIRETDIPLKGLPQDLDGLRILQLSDIHLGLFLSEKELARVIDAALELRPHIAFATGDFISTFGDPLEACIQQLARIKADAGMLGCLGNHEYYAHVEPLATELAARAGIRILRGEAQQLRFGSAVVNVAGVDYQRVANKPHYLREAAGLVYPGALNVLLSHNPDVFPVAARQGYHLTLAGHTHGGQVTVEILDQTINPARFFTPYVRGLYRLDEAAEYVTRGIGTIGIPARIGEAPEVTLLRLRKA